MRWLWLSVLVVVLDQFSKFFISENLTLNPPVELTSWLNLVLAHNTGAAFSFLGEAGGWQRWFFAILAGVVSIVLIVWLLKLPKKAVWMASALALILGGAIGNLIDRVRFGHVVDFIDFHIDTWHFATFNIADAAISVGAVMLLIDAFFLSTHESESDDS